MISNSGDRGAVLAVVGDASRQRTPMPVEVGAVVVQPGVPKLRSNESIAWQDTLKNDAERAKNALARCEAFKAGQRVYHDKHGEGEVAVQNSETPENGDIVVKFDNGDSEPKQLVQSDTDWHFACEKSPLELVCAGFRLNENIEKDMLFLFRRCCAAPRLLTITSILRRRYR